MPQSRRLAKHDPVGIRRLLIQALLKVSPREFTKLFPVVTTEMAAVEDRFVIDDDDDGFASIKDFNKKHDILEIDDDYEGWKNSRYFVKGGNTQIELDGDVVAELIGYKGSIPNSAIDWD